MAFEPRALLRRNRGATERLGVALIVVVVALGLGLRGRTQLAALRGQQTQLAAGAEEIRRFRAQLESVAPMVDTGRVSGAAMDTIVLGVAPGSRLSLAENVVMEAQLAGLRQVRLRFSGLDSSFVPPRTGSGTSPVTVADYTITLECDGGFADVLMFVSRLPVTMSLSRLRANRVVKRGAHFQLVLAVYEAANAKPG